MAAARDVPSEVRGDAARKALLQRVRSLVRDVPDFPRPGILFRDITPILSDPEVLRGVV